MRSPEVFEARSEADLAACIALRHAVFCVEQGVSEADEQDGRDGEARHLLARIGEAPAGTLRMRILGDAAKLERVCVARSARGTGLGAALTHAAMDMARSLPGVSQVKLSAQVDVIAFYERLGFAAHGDAYVDAGILHRDMSRALD
ncbi:MAG: GNAT family N-acetyltransferase [Pseudomonadota bacterium]